MLPAVKFNAKRSQGTKEGFEGVRGGSSFAHLLINGMILEAVSATAIIFGRVQFRFIKMNSGVGRVVVEAEAKKRYATSAARTLHCSQQREREIKSERERERW